MPLLTSGLPKEPAMYKKILVPLDGSAVAEVALPHAIEMAKIFQAELILLRVAFVHFLPGSDPVELESAAVRESEAYLERLAQRLSAEGLKVHTVVRYGKAAEEIIDHAAENQVSVIVMATHGRSGVGRWLLGSTAEKVLRGTEVPVLLIRAKPAPASKTEEP
ncbi:universal stress protein [Candidatus Parcubacteria bacterium]|nr:MAG: universal stress protein [Candidatus Parcubacteria bacterium]